MRSQINKAFALALKAVAACMLSSPLLSQTIPYTSGLYSENFDSLGPHGTNAPLGWFCGAVNNGSGAISRTGPLIVTDGSQDSPGSCNVGAKGASDRALGLEAAVSAGGDLSMEVRILNQTGQPIKSFEIRYDGEQWRANQATRHPQRLEMRYSTNGSSFVSMGTNFYFTETQPDGTNALDGNLAVNRVANIGGVYTPASPVPSGAIIYLRWYDNNDNGWDQLLAVDNFRFQALIAPRDTNPPVVLKAERLRHLTNIVVTFSEAMSTNVLNPTNYLLFQTMALSNTLRIYGYSNAFGAFASTGQTTVQFRTESPLANGYDPTADYTLMASNMTDLASNRIVSPTFIHLIPQCSFQHGFYGYTFCQDTSLTPGTNLGWVALGTMNDSVWADLGDGLPPDETEGLLRFDQIIGTGPTQIPPDAKINSAQLTLYSTRSAENASTRVLMYLLLTNWTQGTATYYGFGTNGVSADGIQATTNLAGSFLPNFPNPNWTNTQSRTVDVTSSIRAWANGQSNYGWLFLGTSQDGYGFDSIKFTNKNTHPVLIVDFESTLELTPLNSTILFVSERSPLQLGFRVSPGTAQFQWYKDGNLIPGANSLGLFSSSASLADAGNYYLLACNASATNLSTTIAVSIIRQLQLTLAQNSHELVLTWTSTNTILQEAPRVGGPWQDLSPPPASPCALPLTSTNKFYRLRPK